MSAIMGIWNFFEGMHANPHDDEVLAEYKARQRQLVSANLVLLIAIFALMGAGWFFDLADADSKGPLAMFAPYRHIVGLAFLAIHGLVIAVSLFCVYRILRLRAKYGVPQ